MNQIKHMKYWGWGQKNKEFNSEKRPYFDQFIKDLFNIKKFDRSAPIPSLESILLPEIKISESNIAEIKALLNKSSIITHSAEERILHSFGKSYRDLYRARTGDFKKTPDLIIYPTTTDCVQKLVGYCNEHLIQIIPFGGGTNIVGGIEALNNKPTICLDMKLMNKVLEIDEVSHIAKIQAGCLGPYLEEQLESEGWTLGHFPDSFEFSTLGGWIATRSAGMQSDKYGKIEDMVFALKMITPKGEIKTLKVPASSTGPNLKHMLIGSEGILGIITEATMQIHKLSPVKIYNGYFFPDFKSGALALKECAQNNVLPVINRLNDANKTSMSIAFKERQTSVKNRLISQAFKKFMFEIKKYKQDEVAMCLTAFEGSQTEVQNQKTQLEKIFKKHGALSVGASPGKTFNETKYDFPYVRDYVMNRKIIADVSETSTTWQKLFTVYENMKSEFRDLEKQLNTTIFLSCHISHSYHTGASLYFTWASPESDSIDAIKKYDLIKSKTEEVFVKHGATLSHHHATGYEHKKWMKEELGEVGILALSSLKKSLDPNNIMNNGKVIDI